MKENILGHSDPHCVSALRMVLAFLLSAFLSGHALGDYVFAAGEPHQFRLRVSSALALVGEPQNLTAMVRSSMAAGKETRVTFAMADADGGEQVLQKTSIGVPSDPEKMSAAEAEWTPHETGEHTLIARFEVRADQGWTDIGETRQTVIASRRRWHFHFWHTRPSIQMITEGMAAKEDLQYWNDRGVIAQTWAFGNAAWNKLTDKKNEPSERISKVAKYWLRDHPVLIDEVNKPDERGQLSGDALALARERSPDQYMAVYVARTAGDRMIEGLRAADRVLVMAYRNVPFGRASASESLSPYVYGSAMTRYQDAKDVGLGDKALLCLSIHKGRGAGAGAVTPQELRRQLHWARYTFPDMPGMAFFGNPLGYDLKINQQLYEFYINPVLRVEPHDDGRVRVTNIGGEHAPAIQIRLVVGAAARRRIKVDIPPLQVGEEYRFGVLPATPDREPQAVGRSSDRGGHVQWMKEIQPVTEYGSDFYVLGPPPLWDREPDRLRFGAQFPWPVPGPVVASGRNLLDHQPSTGKTKSGDEDNAEKTPAALYYEMADTKGRSFLLSYSVRPRVGDGGSIAVRLKDHDGESRLDLEMRNNSQLHGRGSPGWTMLRMTNEEGRYIQEYLALGLKTGAYYQYKIHYSSGGYVRAAIHDREGRKMWDSGEVPTNGEMRFDRIYFSANRQVKWRSTEKAMDLRSVSWQGSFEGRLSGFRLDVYDE